MQQQKCARQNFRWRFCISTLIWKKKSMSRSVFILLRMNVECRIMRRLQIANEVCVCMRQCVCVCVMRQLGDMGESVFCYKAKRSVRHIMSRLSSWDTGIKTTSCPVRQETGRVKNDMRCHKKMWGTTGPSTRQRILILMCQLGSYSFYHSLIPVQQYKPALCLK